MKTWGKRKLDGETIRKIYNRIQQLPERGREKALKELAKEFKCSVSTLSRIRSGYLTPAV